MRLAVKLVEIHMRVTDAVISLSVMLRDAGLAFTDYRSDTGSFYFTVGAIQVRVSNHSGHALKRNEFSVRTDAQTKSKDRIYSANDIRALVARIVEKQVEAQNAAR